VSGYFSQTVITGLDAEDRVWVEIYTQDE
jgi:hypothetical protein